MLLSLGISPEEIGFNDPPVPTDNVQKRLEFIKPGMNTKETESKA